MDSHDEYQSHGDILLGCFMVLVTVAAVAVMFLMPEDGPKKQSTASAAAVLGDTHFVMKPQHVFSEGTLFICVDNAKHKLDVRIRANVGKITKIPPPKAVNSAVGKDGKVRIIRSGYADRCVRYWAPKVERKTKVILTARRNGQLIDKIRFKALPEMDF